MESDFEMRVESIFHIKGRGTVLAGRVHAGEICAGDEVAVISPTKRVVGRVAGLEVARKIVERIRGGDEAAVLFREFDLDAVADGLEKVDQFTVRPVNITLSGARLPKRRWQVWR